LIINLLETPATDTQMAAVHTCTCTCHESIWGSRGM